MCHSGPPTVKSAMAVRPATIASGVPAARAAHSYNRAVWKLAPATQPSVASRPATTYTRGAGWRNNRAIPRSPGMS